jgi:hypothetical protein
LRQLQPAAALAQEVTLMTGIYPWSDRRQLQDRAEPTKVREQCRRERREADRRMAREAVGALCSSDGWQRWLACRRHFHSYSLANQLLIAMQLPDATRIAGFRAWLK